MAIITKCDMCGCCTEQPNERGFEIIHFRNKVGEKEFILCAGCSKAIKEEIYKHPKYNVIGIEVQDD